MNKSVLIAILLTIICHTTYGQVMGFREPLVNVAVKVGGTYMSLSSAPVKSTPGPMAGLYAWKKIGRYGVRLEVLGSMVSYATKYPASYYSLYTPGMDTVSKGEFQCIYLHVPLLLEYQLSDKLQVLAGPQFNYVLSVSDKNDAFTNIYGANSFIKKTDISIAAGAEYALGKKLKAGARIMAGVIDVNNSNYYLVPRAWSTFGAQLAISYKIM